MLPISHSLFRENNSAIADVQLRAVIRNSQTHRETKGVTEPVDGLADIRISQLGDDRTPRYRAVCEHFVYLPLGIVLDWPNLGGGWSPGNDLVNASLSHSR